MTNRFVFNSRRTPRCLSRSRRTSQLADLLAGSVYRSVEEALGAGNEDKYWRRMEEKVRRLMREKGKMEEEIVEL